MNPIDGDELLERAYEIHNNEHDPEGVMLTLIQEIESGSFAIKEDTTGWKRIESTFYQEFRCLVSDGRNVGMGGYMDGQWYADDMSPIMSEEITHYLIVGTPVKEDERV